MSKDTLKAIKTIQYNLVVAFNTIAREYPEASILSLINHVIRDVEHLKVSIVDIEKQNLLLTIANAELNDRLTIKKDWTNE